jgi:hypothetical protein
MVPDLEWLSPTRSAGLAAYTASLLACGLGWANGRRKHLQVRPFGVLAAVQCGLLLDMVFDWRWKIHEFWMQEAMAVGVYGQRRRPQALVLGLLVLAATLGLLLVLARFRGRVGLAIAMAGTLVSVGLWFCESVSLHMVDQIFYFMVGKVMFVSLLWVGVALTTCFGVWLDVRDRSLRRAFR